MKKFLFVFCLLIFSSLNILFSQNSLPAKNDSLNIEFGVLEAISTHPEVFLTPLPPEVNETSGLVFWRGKLWTHNDSGGEPEIYAIDTATGSIVQTVTLSGAKNNDWEEITQDADFFYIGDFGNNRGTRKDLRIFKLPKNEIPPQGNVEIDNFELIEFSYADQKVFEKKINQHNFDCEAMTSMGDSIYLFTKNWGDQQTRMYALPKEGGNYVVHPRTSFDVGGLITGAALNDKGDELALIGYVDFESFLWLFWDFDGANFFGGQKLLVKFPDLVFVQTEAICFVSENDMLFSCEESSEFPTLFSINSDDLKAIALSKLGNYISSNIIISGMPPKVNNRLKIDIIELPAKEFTIELRNKRWTKLFEETAVKEMGNKKMTVTFKTKDLDPGLYFVKITSGDYSLVRKVNIKH